MVNEMKNERIKKETVESVCDKSRMNGKMIVMKNGIDE
jgi:hypothetical protein